MIKQNKSSIDDLASSLHDLTTMVDGQFKEVKDKIDGAEDRLNNKMQSLSDRHDKTLDLVYQHDVKIARLEESLDLK